MAGKNKTSRQLAGNHGLECVTVTVRQAAAALAQFWSFAATGQAGKGKCGFQFSRCSRAALPTVVKMKQGLRQVAKTVGAATEDHLGDLFKQLEDGEATGSMFLSFRGDYRSSTRWRRWLMNRCSSNASRQPLQCGRLSIRYQLSDADIGYLVWAFPLPSPCVGTCHQPSAIPTNSFDPLLISLYSLN